MNVMMMIWICAVGSGKGETVANFLYRKQTVCQERRNKKKKENGKWEIRDRRSHCKSVGL